MRQFVLILALWAVPNSEAAWWHDLSYEVCMINLNDEEDWECETRLVALGE